MPKETDRLNLPLPLGNENVTRESINGIFEKIDAGVATQADLDTLREAVSKMDIPDASLTQKGKVQLTNDFKGTSETRAVTARALHDGLDDAYKTSVNYVETRYNDVVDVINRVNPPNIVVNSSAQFGLLNWAKASGTANFNSFYKEDDISYFTSYDKNGATVAALKSDSFLEDYNFDNSITFSVEFYTLQTEGLIWAEFVKTGTGTVLATLTPDANKNWHRKSITFTPLFEGPYFVRLVVAANAPSIFKGWRRVMVNLGQLYPYNSDANERGLFQLVSDGKSAIAAAITGKGVSASGSDTHQQLAQKINQLQLGKKFATGTANVKSDGYFDITGLSFQPGAVNFQMSTVVGVGGAHRYDSVGGINSSQSEGFYYNGSSILRVTNITFGSNSITGLNTGWTGSGRTVNWIAYSL